MYTKTVYWQNTNIVKIYVYASERSELAYEILAFLHTVKPRPEAHMDMILFEVFLKNIHLIPQYQIVRRHYL